LNSNCREKSGEKREPNQAYIRLTSDIYRADFFPPVSVHFTLFTDDGKTLICTRAQQNGKAIHTPHNNLTFYKIDDETYYMDYSS
jgi:hypothetical protein